MSAHRYIEPNPEDLKYAGMKLKKCSRSGRMLPAHLDFFSIFNYKYPSGKIWTGLRPESRKARADAMKAHREKDYPNGKKAERDKLKVDEIAEVFHKLSAEFGRPPTAYEISARSTLSKDCVKGRIKRLYNLLPEEMQKAYSLY